MRITLITARLCNSTISRAVGHTEGCTAVRTCAGTASLSSLCPVSSAFLFTEIVASNQGLRRKGANIHVDMLRPKRNLSMFDLYLFFIVSLYLKINGITLRTGYLGEPGVEIYRGSTQNNILIFSSALG